MFSKAKKSSVNSLQILSRQHQKGHQFIRSIVEIVVVHNFLTRFLFRLLNSVFRHAIIIVE